MKTCVPHEGTQPNTPHVLRHIEAPNVTKVAIWRGTFWLDDENVDRGDAPITPEEYTEWGWRYVGPSLGFGGKL